MTVVNHEARNQYSATNNQTVFNYTFEIADQSNIQIFQRAASAEPDDVADLLVYGVDYTLTGVGGANGGTFILTTGATTGDVITAQGNAPAERDTSFTPGGVIQAANLNTEFDNDILIYQTILAKLDNLTPKYAKSAFVTDVDLVLPVLGENQFWAMNGDATQIEALDITSVVGGGTVTQVNTGTGLTGGPITGAGTISFAAIAATTLWANITGGSAVPTEVPISDLATYMFPAASVSRQMLQSTAFLAPVWSTSTWPATTTQNRILYSSSTNVVGEITSANNSTLVTSAGGVPSWSQTLPQAVQTNIQYLGEQNQNFDMGGFQINDMAEPSQPSDAATKNYVDLNALTGTSVYAASAASLGTVTQAGSGVGATLTNAGVQAVFELDGVNPPAASVVLIKNTATGMTDANEGIYTVTDVGSGATNWVLTRATTYDTPTEINQTGLIIIQNGSTLAGTAWYNAATIVTVDTTSFSYSQFGNIIFPVSLANGGTNANLVASAGSVVYSTGTAMAFSAVGASGQIFQSTGTTAPGWTTATYPSVATSTGSFIYANGTNFVASTSLWPNTVGSAGKIIISDGTSNVYSTPLWPTTAGTSGSIVISDGTNKINSTSLWPNTVGTAGKIVRSDGTTNAYTTATFADTYSASTLLYSNGANTVTGLATANSAALVTGSTGVPVWSSTMTNGQIIIGSTGATPVAASLTAGNNITITPGAGTITIATTAAGGKPLIQEVYTQTGAVNTGSTLIPIDDTIPQSGEGNEYMTLAITPTNASNLLVIEAQLFVAFSVASYLSAALFQDSTANSLTAVTQYQTTLGGGVMLNIQWVMAAGTTSATTFKIRAGGHVAGTMTFNGLAGARIFGGVINSYMRIQEITV